MLRISAERMFRRARGARFDDRFQFHWCVAQKTVGHFELIAYSFHVVIHEPRRHTASTRSKGGHSMFGRSVCQLRAEQMTHTTCFSCVFIRCVSQWTKPPSSSRNFVQFLCQPVPALDDQVCALQQDLCTQPSLQRSRFSWVALRAHRGFLSSAHGGSVGWSCAATPGCECHSQHPAGCAHNRSSHGVNMEAILCPQIEHDGFDR